MFDKRKMKLIANYKKAQEYLILGEPVYMVKLNGSLEKVTEDNWMSVLFHNLEGGRYAVYRKKLIDIGEFQKDIHIGKRVISVSHTKKGGGASWMFVSYRGEE